MPKPSRHTLIWSEVHQHYNLHSRGQPEQCFLPGDELAFSLWLAGHSSFAFWGRAGRIFVLKETRPRGTGYWYAYSTHARHTRKRYLGPNGRVTFARLEEEAKILACSPSPAPLTPKPPLYEAVSPTAQRSEIGQERPRITAESQDKQIGVLLSTRLFPPHLPASLVERSRLLRELDAVRSHLLTLVSASAGSGKTTLLSTWVAAFFRPQAGEGMAQDARPSFAWLSLEELDNDPIRFWTSVIAALRACLPRIGETALAMLHTPPFPPPSTILTVLLTELLEAGRELILILDDYHVIEDQTIHEAMLFLLDHLPPTLHLILSTRTDPELPLARLRMRGQLLEIRDRDLRFTQEEVASFLKEGMDLPLSEKDVKTLSERTEGWIAGLQLAALSLRKREDLSPFVKEFAGSHRFVLDYVQQDILARLSDPLQDFLLQTSILSSMHAALCQAVTTNASQKVCQEMLETLDRANLFVVPLDEQRQWYRFHDLFREALCARLQATRPERMPLLRIRAARWYEGAGELREAIAHALAAPDYPYAASLMEQAAPHSWLCGEVRTVLNWVLALPDTVLCAHTRLALNAALRLINSINLSNETLYSNLQAQMERLFTRMDGILHSTALSEAEVALIGRRLRLLRALMEARTFLKRGDTERLSLLSQEIEALPQDEEVNWSIIPLTLTFWLNVYLKGEGASLIPRLLVTKQALIEAGDHLVSIRVMTMLVHAYTQAAQWRQAKFEGLEVLALIEQIGERTIWSGYLYYNLHITSYAQNRLEEASDWLQRLLESTHDWQQVELLVRGEICSAQLALVKGDLSAAYQALQKLGDLVEQEGYAYHAPWVISLRVQCWLTQGNLAQASAWAAQTVFHPDAWNPWRKGELLMLVRVLLTQQKYSQAVETLSRFSEHLNLPGDIKTTIEWMVLSVVALYHAGKREEAARVASRLLRQAAPEDAIRVYLDAGEPMKQVLLSWFSATNPLKALSPQEDEALQDDAPEASAVSLSSAFVSRVLAAFAQEEFRAAGRPLVVDAPLTSMQEILPAPILTEEPQPGTEPLSRQELKVLRLLVAGHTYAEIAQALIVSPHTVKTQVSSIYRKLGVRRRAEAIAVTGRLHLL
jgi:LuxR family maltose regulon positive regulatory protein